MIQALVLNGGGTLETYFVDRKPASCTVSVYTGSMALKVNAQACSIDPVNTTTAGAVAAGDTTVTVGAGVGATVVVGRRYLLAAEEVGVKSISGDILTLWSPLTLDHSAGATFVGLRVWADISSTLCDGIWWDGYAVFTPAAGDANTEGVDCVRRKIPDTLIDMSDIREIIPPALKAISEELDIQRAFRTARDNLLLDLGGKNRAQTILGVDHFRRPCAIRFWLDRRFEFGDEWLAQMKILETEYQRLVEQILSQAPVDADQDGITNGPGDRGFTCIQVERA